MASGKHNGHKRSSEHPRWNNNRMYDARGYVRIRVGISHPLADERGFAYEHWVVWIPAGNPKPPGFLNPGKHLGVHIHHRNGNITDNRIENLEILTPREHALRHDKFREKDAHGQYRGVKAPGQEEED